mgnify:CR=1 FL=1
MYTIQDLREGRVAVKNDGTLQELQKVLRKAFPEDNTNIHGDSITYYKCNLFEKNWKPSSYITNLLPVQSVKDFLQESGYPKVMWVRQNSFGYWHKRVVVGENKIGYLAWNHAKNFEEVDKCQAGTVWFFAKDMGEIPEYTIEELTEKLGHEFKIKKQ